MLSGFYLIRLCLHNNIILKTLATILVLRYIDELSR